MSKHTPLPWKVRDHYVMGGDGHCQVCSCWRSPSHLNSESVTELQANAEFIVLAVNCHEDLLKACRVVLSHVEELRQAWQTGALSEHDGRGGTRSNRNVEAECQLRDAIAKAEPTE